MSSVIQALMLHWILLIVLILTNMIIQVIKEEERSYKNKNILLICMNVGFPVVILTLFFLQTQLVLIEQFVFFTLATFVIEVGLLISLERLLFYFIFAIIIMTLELYHLKKTDESSIHLEETIFFPLLTLLMIPLIFASNYLQYFIIFILFDLLIISIVKDYHKKRLEECTNTKEIYTTQIFGSLLLLVASLLLVIKAGSLRFNELIQYIDQIGGKDVLFLPMFILSIIGLSFKLYSFPFISAVIKNSRIENPSFIGYNLFFPLLPISALLFTPLGKVLFSYLNVYNLMWLSIAIVLLILAILLPQSLHKNFLLLLAYIHFSMALVIEGNVFESMNIILYPIIALSIWLTHKELKEGKKEKKIEVLNEKEETVRKAEVETKEETTREKKEKLPLLSPIIFYFNLILTIFLLLGIPPFSNIWLLLNYWYSVSISPFGLLKIILSTLCLALISLIIINYIHKTIIKRKNIAFTPISIASFSIVIILQLLAITLFSPFYLLSKFATSFFDWADLILPSIIISATYLFSLCLFFTYRLYVIKKFQLKNSYYERFTLKITQLLEFPLFSFTLSWIYTNIILFSLIWLKVYIYTKGIKQTIIPKVRRIIYTVYGYTKATIIPAIILFFSSISIVIRKLEDGDFGKQLYLTFAFLLVLFLSVIIFRW